MVSQTQVPPQEHSQPNFGASSPDEAKDLTYQVRFAGGRTITRGGGTPAFTIAVVDERQLEWLEEADAYSAALAYIRGDFDVQGDMVAAIRHQTSRPGRRWKNALLGWAARMAPGRIETWIQPRARACENIRYHYDRSNGFYRHFLDSRMVYSCAYFERPSASLDEAQLAKLDHICRKLELQPGDRFLDIGCGWGALVMRAAEQYGARATGCTLSLQQAEYGRSLAAGHGLPGSVAILESDYRDVEGRFDKIASIGMCEHVGRHRLRSYFRKVQSLLERGGLFLNQGIVRPQSVRDDAQTLFLQRHIFPGGELPCLAEVIRGAEMEGFEILDAESLRPHYALTCRAWVRRLQENAEACMRFVTREMYRTWLLYLAGSALSFEQGLTDIYQLLMARPPGGGRRLTREHMYAPRIA